MEQEPIISEPARRHGVTDEDMLHALAHHMRRFTMTEGMVVFIGPATNGALLEVGVVEWYEDLAIVHAMPARKRFTR